MLFWDDKNGKYGSFIWVSKEPGNVYSSSIVEFIVADSQRNYLKTPAWRLCILLSLELIKSPPFEHIFPVISTELHILSRNLPQKLLLHISSVLEIIDETTGRYSATISLCLFCWDNTTY